MEEEERGSGSGRTVFFVSCSAGSSSAQVGRELAPRTAQPAAAPGGILRPPPPVGRDGTGWDGEMGPVPVPLGTWIYRAGSGAGAGAGPPEARHPAPGWGAEPGAGPGGGAGAVPARFGVLREGLGRGGCGSAGDGGAEGQAASRGARWVRVGVVERAPCT